MSDKQQKNQLMLAFSRDESRSEAPRVSAEGTESVVAKRGTESLAMGEQLMEEVCERENCKQALARVKANQGSAGVDGMTVHELPEFLKQQWPAIREQLLSGTYKPKPVKRVEIPKPDGGGGASYGIPTVLDRFIQQAVLQVLQQDWDRTFSDHSYGFLAWTFGASERWWRRSSTSPQAIAGWWIWIWRSSSTGSINDRLMAKIAERVSDKRFVEAAIRVFCKPE